MGYTGKRILIVEDEPTIGQVCRRTLRAEGIDVDIAPNGRVARAMMGKDSYDLYLVDIRTPEVNGMQLYRYLQEDLPAAAAKVIFTSGDTLSGDIGLFIKGTGRPFLAKPFTPAQLRAAVKEALSAVAIPAAGKSKL